MAEITYVQAVAEALREEMKRDENVFLLGEDMGVYGGCFGVTKGFLKEFGEERIMDTPISEAGFTGAAVGAAIMGMRPVVEIMFSDFVTLASDNLVNQAAKIRFMLGGQVKVPMVLRTPAGSGTGAAAQHSQSLEAWMVHIPGLKVVMPSTPYDAKGLLKAAIRDDNPVMFYEHKLLYKTKGEVPEGDYVLPIGKADVKKTGKDVTIIAYSIMVLRALEAANKLAQEGIDVEVVDLRSLSPIDDQTIVASVKKTGKVLIVHEAVKRCGVGAEIAAIIADSEAFYYLDAPIKRLAGLEVPIPYSPSLEKGIVPQVDDIIKSVKELLMA
ncbi:MAG: alpha-ketoacid dehydrogenase subunit beta [Bacteroidota bacterium]